MGFWHTHTTWAACALLTLPFALLVCKASGGVGVVSLDLRRRPFSWPLSASKEPSLPSARFLARSVFHERDFLYGTGTTETSTGQSERSCLSFGRKWLSGPQQFVKNTVISCDILSVKLVALSCIKRWCISLLALNFSINAGVPWSEQRKFDKT